jgi:Protein of unknown function (DUF3027)
VALSGAGVCPDGGQLLTVNQLRVRAKEPDEACAQATDLARGAAEEVAGAGRVGAHVGVQADGDRVVTHLFSCLDQAYQGWHWAVTLARASWSKTVTVSESVLVPGPDAILAPDWVPWRERLLPGDLGVGDILPAPPDDERLVPVAVLEGDDGVADWGVATWAATAFTEAVVPLAGEDQAGTDRAGTDRAGTDRAGTDRAGTDPAGEDPAEDDPLGAGPAGEFAAAEVAAEFAEDEFAAGELPAGRLAPEDTLPVRARVLSAIGRDTTAARWYASEHGPKTPLAHAAPGPCAGCGFFVRLAGPLGQVFGVCANAYAPDDGRVVTVDHGCGAHSESVFPGDADQPLRPVIDELGYDLVDRPGVSVDETVFEPLDHG